jgi:hypothetical protein
VPATMQSDAMRRSGTNDRCKPAVSNYLATSG